MTITQPYSKAVCITDCSEIFIRSSSPLTARAHTYSSYKHHNIVKFLLATTPTGAISFVLKCWAGRVSDAHLAVKSRLLQLIYHVDLVIADHDFDISDKPVFVGVTLKIRPFTKEKPQLSQREL